ncbi:hypothetical protein IscW_ISCW009642, partial [Ixodes scapularis]
PASASQWRSLPLPLSPPPEPPPCPRSASTNSAPAFGATTCDSIIAPTASVTITAGEPHLLAPRKTKKGNYPRLYQRNS